MEDHKIIVYRYRWLILAMFMQLMSVQQLLWITFASITKSAAAFYKVSDLGIGLLSMVFMIIYIIVSIPASWLIDKYGFRIAVGLGAALTGVFGLLRGLFSSNYTLVLVFQIFIAVGQPLIVNAVSTIAARWFPFKERATATGMSWLAGYLGLIVGLVLTPYLTNIFNISGMLLIYGIISIIAISGFLCFARENPPTPQCSPDQEGRSLVFDGIKQIIVKKDFILFTVVFFIGLGVFNGLSTWIEDIVRPRGFSSAQAGIIGGLMVASGVVGSGIVPLLSDKLRNRSRFVLLAVAGSIPGLIGLTFAGSYWVILISGCIFGFFLLSTAPVGFQYCAEIGFPAPEGTSTGILMMAGQISGIIFIFVMDMFKSPETGSMTLSMVISTALMILNAFISSRLRESK
ncbi:MAG: major facilitator superfamily domain-containing protein 7, partial [Ruminiclostridium sp.]|nr:major facilitator superfamily domain-containing protein 7 [Ruminiclostridium sp.]